MPTIRKIELDVLKPRQPNVLEFAEVIAAVSPDYVVHVDVEEMDDKTETLKLVVEGRSLDFSFRCLTAQARTDRSSPVVKVRHDRQTSRSKPAKRGR